MLVIFLFISLVLFFFFLSVYLDDKDLSAFFLVWGVIGSFLFLISFLGSKYGF